MKNLLILIVLFSFPLYAADIATWSEPIRTIKNVGNMNNPVKKIWQTNANIPPGEPDKYLKRSPTDNNVIQAFSQKEKDIYKRDLWIAQKARWLMRLNSAAFDWRNFDSAQEMRDERDAKIASVDLLVTGNTTGLKKIGW